MTAPKTYKWKRPRRTPFHKIPWTPEVLEAWGWETRPPCPNGRVVKNKGGHHPC